MKKLKIKTINSYWFKQKQTNITKQLIKKLYHFLASYYHLSNEDEFQRLILRPEENGELIIYFGKNEEIAGFSRNFRQEINIGKKQVSAYLALIYLNPQYISCPTIASTGLTDAINYKLTHPQEEVIYVAFADNPLTYEFIYQLSDTIYPKPAQPVPDQIITVINALKKQNELITIHNHPMVVSSLLLPINHQLLGIQDDELELNDFYVSANPDYLQGNSLLVYIPLHLANISYGLNHQDSIYIEQPESLQNQGYPGDSAELHS